MPPPKARMTIGSRKRKASSAAPNHARSPPGRVGGQQVEDDTLDAASTLLSLGQTHSETINASLPTPSCPLSAAIDTSIDTSLARCSSPSTQSSSTRPQMGFIPPLVRFSPALEEHPKLIRDQIFSRAVLVPIDPGITWSITHHVPQVHMKRGRPWGPQGEDYVWEAAVQLFLSSARSCLDQLDPETISLYWTLARARVFESYYDLLKYGNLTREATKVVLEGLQKFLHYPETVLKVPEAEKKGLVVHAEWTRDRLTCNYVELEDGDEYLQQNRVGRPE